MHSNCVLSGLKNSFPNNYGIPFKRDAFFAKTHTYLGMSDAMTDIIATLISFARIYLFSQQLLSAISFVLTVAV